MGGLEGKGWMIHPATKMSALTLPDILGSLLDSTEHEAKYMVPSRSTSIRSTMEMSRVLKIAVFSSQIFC
jgi:hypothetical protein